MKILVISDTHGSIDQACNIIKDTNGLNLIIHLGDYFRDAQKLSRIFKNIPVEYICGNSDFMVGGVPSEKLLEYEGKKIFITHGHKYSVKWNYERLYEKAEEKSVDLLLFGHTHIADLVDRGRYYIVNPGSLTEARNNAQESYALIEIDQRGVKPEIMCI